MNSMADMVAVVTGGASGIGFGLAEIACRNNMRVLLADIDEQGVTTAADNLRMSYGRVEYVVTDVANRGDVEQLAETCCSLFGACHLLFNNAGIAVPTDIVDRAWNVPIDEWRRIIDVNIWGIINGCNVFIPRMIEQGDPCHIVNTASIVGLTGDPEDRNPAAIYRMTKAAIVGLTEALAGQLSSIGANIKMSVLCPSFVATSVIESTFNDWTSGDSAQLSMKEQYESLILSGSDPIELAEIVFRAIRENEFYILPHQHTRNQVRSRFRRILQAFKNQKRT